MRLLPRFLFASLAIALTMVLHGGPSDGGSLWGWQPPGQASDGQAGDGQDTGTRDDAGPTRPRLSEAVATRRYNKAVERWRKSLRDLTHAKVYYSISDESEREAAIERWVQGMTEQLAAITEVHETGADAYAAGYQPQERLEQFLISLAAHDIDNGRFKLAYELLKRLKESGSEYPQLDAMLGNAAVFANQFVDAKAAMLRAQEQKILGPEGQSWLKQADTLQQLWEKEQKIRRQEAEADDLPRVLLHTTQGDIVIELYENEAPDTVANFIYLVEEGFYDGLQFFMVERATVAQTGCPTNNGKGTPGYSIYSEAFQPNARPHFAGTLAMAQPTDRDGRPVPDSAGSQFFISCRPAMRLNGQFTAFGRVIEGLAVVSLLQAQGEEAEKNKVPGAPPTAPDRILYAKVLRKRDHKYVPNKVSN